MANAITSGDAKVLHHRILAYATSFVHSKPQELTYREYFRLLYQHTAKGRREDALSSAFRHLDRSSWWRSEYQRAKRELSRTEGELRAVKMMNDELKARAEIARPNSPVKKRKKIDEDIVPVPRSPKRVRKDLTLSQKDLHPAEAIAEFDFSGTGEVGTSLMQRFFHINAILKSSQKTDPYVLARECVDAASTISQIVERVFQEAAAEGEINELKSVVTVSNRAVLSLIMGYNRLSNVAEGPQVQGTVTYAYVHMFEQLLENLPTIARSEAMRLDPVESGRTHEGESSKSKANRAAISGNIGANRKLSLLVTFLTGIVDNLDPRLGAHTSLFEGFAYNLLERVGSRLYVLVFGYQRRHTLEAEIAMAKGDNDDTSSKSEETDLKAAKIEAPHLIRLFEHVMAAAPAYLPSSSNNQNDKAKSTKSRRSRKGALAAATKEKLQRTLVKCMFGGENTLQDGPLMDDSLRPPRASNLDLQTPKVREADVKDWFTEEVWKLLGWDILSREQ